LKTDLLIRPQNGIIFAKDLYYNLTAI